MLMRYAWTLAGIWIDLEMAVTKLRCNLDDTTLLAMDISPRNCLSLQLRLSDLALVNRGSGHRAGDRRTNIRPVDISSKADQYIRGTSKMSHTHFTLTLNIFKQIRHSVTFFFRNT